MCSLGYFESLSFLCKLNVYSWYRCIDNHWVFSTVVRHELMKDEMIPSIFHSTHIHVLYLCHSVIVSTHRERDMSKQSKISSADFERVNIFLCVCCAVRSCMCVCVFVRKNVGLNCHHEKTHDGLQWGQSCAARSVEIWKEVRKRAYAIQKLCFGFVWTPRRQQHMILMKRITSFIVHSSIFFSCGELPSNSLPNMLLSQWLTANDST